MVVSEILLAPKWPVSTVLDCLNNERKSELVEFLKSRYEERFLKPIRLLRKAPAAHQGYGFAVMSLCSLLVESIQCCRDGLPSTNEGELKRLTSFQPPPSYRIAKNERKNGRRAFRDFFTHFSNLFPGVNGDEFYENIRNGLLHQAQTKAGWTVKVKQTALCEPTKKVIDRDRFADSLEHAFKEYLDELRHSHMASALWRKAKRRIWWLVQLSQ